MRSFFGGEGGINEQILIREIRKILEGANNIYLYLKGPAQPLPRGAPGQGGGGAGLGRIVINYSDFCPGILSSVWNRCHPDG